MKNKVVLVTGASRGIGKEIAMQFLKQGAFVIMTCKENEKLMVKLFQEIDEKRVYGFVGDLSIEENVINLYAEIQVAIKTNRIPHMPNIIINNAGISYIGLTQFMYEKDWRKVIETNLSAPFFVTKNFLPYMIDKKNGLIINISSIWGEIGASMEVAYSASKAGLEGMTKALAKELELSNVDVIAFRLGMVDTDMNKCFDKDDLVEIKKELVDGKIATPREVARELIKIVENKRYTSGDIINIKKGWFK